MNKKSYRVGYAFWGFLSDYKLVNSQEISSPDGNSTYSYSIIHELLKRNAEIYFMMPDRDKESVEKYGKDAFKSFSQEKRWNVYNNFTKLTETTPLPDLDILLLEWRFPIIGRNCVSIDKNEGIWRYPTLQEIKEKKYQPDLYIQRHLINYYRNTHNCNTKIIFWDLDNKLTFYDEKYNSPDAIFETAINPNHQYIHRTSVNIPCIIEDLLQFKTENYNSNKELVYIGSRYERDDVIDQYIKPYANERKEKVHFYGNWLDYPDKHKEALERWPGIVFNKRITVRDFHNVYKDTVAVPLLGKKQYFKNGFITARIFESIMFGSIPIFFNEQMMFSNSDLFFRANDYNDLIDIVNFLKNSKQFRNNIRRNIAEELESFDVKYFVNKIEEILNT